MVPIVKFGGKGIAVWGSSSGFVPGTCSVMIQHTVDHPMPPSLWQHFGEASVLLSVLLATVSYSEL